MDELEGIVDEIFEPVLKSIFDVYQKRADEESTDHDDVIVVDLKQNYGAIHVKLLKALIRYSAMASDFQQPVIGKNEIMAKVQKQVDHIVFNLANSIAEVGYYRIDVKDVRDKKLFFNVKKITDGDFERLLSFAHTLNLEGLHARVKDNVIVITDPHGDARVDIKLIRNAVTGKLNLFVKQNVEAGDTVSEFPQAMLFEHRDDIVFLAKVFTVLQDRMSN